MIDAFIDMVRSVYRTDALIPLHAPVFYGREKEYLNHCIDTTFVSSVGEYVDRFEAMTAEYTGAAGAVAAMNGTAALHIALQLAGVDQDSDVITQALTFVATSNAIRYCGAEPIYIDVDDDTLGMSPRALKTFLETHADQQAGQTVNRFSGRVIRAVLPMHSYGFPCRIREIVEICQSYNIPVIEDAAESLGSRIGTMHTGRFGQSAILSYNGNKTITTGGGGMIISDNTDLLKDAKHITTTAKTPHPWHYVHDQVGYNYRLTNLNAALGCAQMEYLDEILAQKRELHGRYTQFFTDHTSAQLLHEPEGSQSNYWLNAIRLPDRKTRDAFLEATNSAGVMTRPVWRLMTELPAFQNAQHDGLTVSRALADQIVNIPSSVFQPIEVV